LIDGDRAEGAGLWLRIGAAAGILGLAVQSVFETGLRMPANALLFALLAAIVVHESRAADSAEASAEPPVAGAGDRW
jgi:hypothetical protein